MNVHAQQNREQVDCVDEENRKEKIIFLSE
jgi:hypothetical protein